jgi:ssRNA-specific RNase YbeY (16S rRNA maturation enzyme)
MPSNILGLNEALDHEVFVYGGIARAEDAQYYIHSEELEYTSYLGLTRYHISDNVLTGITIKMNYDRFQYIPEYNISYTLWHEMLHMVGFTHCDGDNTMNAILKKMLVIDDKQLEMFKYKYNL